MTRGDWLLLDGALERWLSKHAPKRSKDARQAATALLADFFYSISEPMNERQALEAPA